MHLPHARVILRAALRMRRRPHDGGGDADRPDGAGLAAAGTAAATYTKGDQPTGVEVRLFGADGWLSTTTR